jgi:hypothetical protein
MGKMLDVELVRISCDASGADPGNDLELLGSFWGTTFNEDLIEKPKEVIYSFPDGPIKLTPGQTVRIGTSARFALSTPDVDGANEPFKAFLKFGGELFEMDNPPDDSNDRLDGSFRTISNRDNIGPDTPMNVRIGFDKFGQEVRADFVVTFAHHL